jgi:hypothetical protein
MSGTAFQARRHAQLFELIRQSNLSERTDLRLRIEKNRRRNAGTEAGQAESFLLSAQKSWSEPGPVSQA